MESNRKSLKKNEILHYEVNVQLFMEAIEECIKHKSIKPLELVFKTATGSVSDKKSVLDLLWRKYMVSLLLDGNLKNIQKCEICIDLSMEAAKAELCSTALSSLLLSDLYDGSTIAECEYLFHFVEDRVDIWKTHSFFSTCKNQLLRLCNDLLRRLCQSQNTVFSGRILLFLARFFPLSERSGLNIVSEFNLDNVTIFGKEDNTADDNNIKDVLNEENGLASLSVDYNLYFKFWCLQDFFRNPNLCYNKIPWKTFSSHSDDVLEAFSSFKLDSALSTNKNTDYDSNSFKSMFSHYFAKYLTSQKLLELQLSDSNFRRYILVQFLTLFQYLKSTVKFKPENYLLDDDQSNWIDKTTEKVYKLICETLPNGASFCHFVKHQLKREEKWSMWKNEGCPEFKAPSTNVIECNSKLKMINKKERKRAGDEIRNAIAEKKNLMGNCELTRLWNLSPNNMEACKSQDRDFMPSLEAYFEETILQSQREDIKEEEKLINDPNFAWRALRLLARRSPYFFSYGNMNTETKISVYLDSMIKKIAKDVTSHIAFPSQKIEHETLQTETQEADMEDELLKEKDEVERYHGQDDCPESNNDHDRLLTLEEAEKLALNLGKNWKKLAVKLGFAADQIEYFETQISNCKEQGKLMLQIWIEESSEDATVENLLYIMQGLKMEKEAKGILC